MWLRAGIRWNSCKNGDETFSSVSGGEFLGKLMTVTFRSGSVHAIPVEHNFPSSVSPKTFIKWKHKSLVLSGRGQSERILRWVSQGECKITADDLGATLRCSSSTQFRLLLLNVYLSLDSRTETLWRWTWVDSWHLDEAEKNLSALALCKSNYVIY